MRLGELLKEHAREMDWHVENADTEITGLTSDSRRVEPGYLFAALPGTETDGRAFIGEAVRRGAAAVLVPADTLETDVTTAGRQGPVALLIDPNPRRRLALMASQFYGRQPRSVAAVTGTNGKTSVVTFLRQIWADHGRRAASIGTLGVAGPGVDMPGALTTPDPVQLHEMLSRLADRGIDSLALEASSHGLSQYRLDGVDIAAAAFTNLSRDHLDYHGSMAAYFAAKRRLFTEILATDGVAILNGDVAVFPELSDAVRRRGLRSLTYGLQGSDIRLASVQPTANGQLLHLVVTGTAYRVTLPLVGEFQAMNALCAVGLALATGCDAGTAVKALESLTGVPGRLEQVATLGNGASAIVDYAHTPEALAAALRAVRPHATGRVIIVFGCGGNRDAGKRPEMGRVAADYAEEVIITDDNPRREDPAEIRRQILVGCPQAREIGDRGEAIAAAVRDLTAGDILVVAGKGHETDQIVGDAVMPFNDAEVVRAAVAEFQT